METAWINNKNAPEKRRAFQGQSDVFRIFYRLSIFRYFYLGAVVFMVPLVFRVPGVP